MTSTRNVRLPEILKAHDEEVLREWMARQLESIASRRDLISEDELRRQSREFLKAFIDASTSGGLQPNAPQWTAVREQLVRLSRSRAEQGFSPSETATFVFSLKQPLFERLRQAISDPR